MRHLFLEVAERAEEGKWMSPGAMQSRVGFHGPARTTGFGLSPLFEI